MSTTMQDAPDAGSTLSSTQPIAMNGQTPSSPRDAQSVSATFADRHIGPRDHEIDDMLRAIGFESITDLMDAAVPASIRMPSPLSLPSALSEQEAVDRLEVIAEKNQVFRSLIGMGYSATIVPSVIQRNILENPGWYTQYTPYQSEIAQGRLEALLNFQTMVSDLTALPVAGASLLDEGTAAAEAMAMCHAASRGKRSTFLIATDCHPQTIEVVRTRAASLGIDIQLVEALKLDLDSFSHNGESSVCGMLVQYPATDGRVHDYAHLATSLHDNDAQLVVAADILSLTLLRPPGEFGADIAVGSTQRFGVPMGAGGPHAAYIACTQAHTRRMPGRIIGVSRDSQGNPAYRMAIQTREQHIKRDRATSNICTAQALLAIMASMYAVYHGPEGLRAIATRIHALTLSLRDGLRKLGHEVVEDTIFDTIRVRPVDTTTEAVLEACKAKRINLRDFADGSLGIMLDERADASLIQNLLEAFGLTGSSAADSITNSTDTLFPTPHARQSDFLTHPVFNTHRSETQLLRYMYTLQQRDLSLATSMIPLGSCTMKLNATTEMIAVTWPQFAQIHPFAPADQQTGYAELYSELETWLAEVTGFQAVSLQPNAGSQGEYAGLMVISAYHQSRSDPDRNVCLIPTSAHGTNPASAVIAGMRVVPITCDDKGNIDLADLSAKAEQHSESLAAIMITYPSTHGVFEETIRGICKIVHDHGGQVYMDGANMNAQVGYCSPGDLGADVCHLNLHKTFCIPHGGGGPGMGPICVAKHLAPFLPSHPVQSPQSAGDSAIGPISAAPYGSPAILPISWAYIAMMGADGLTRATEVAVLNANYMAHRLKDHYDVVFTGTSGRVAHEFIIDLRPFDKSAGIKPDDVAKRLIDYGFHAPTMSWPVPGTLMIEPTESEDRAELDRYCDALIAIRAEIKDIEEGRADSDNNVLRNAPHTTGMIASDDWQYPYSRQKAAFPAPWLRDNKFWPFVGRVDNPYGDRNLICTCPSVEELSS